MVTNDKSIFLFEQKNGLNKKDQRGPDDCNRPDLGSRPGSAGASFRSRMLENTWVIRVSVILRVPAGPSDHANPGPPEIN